MANKEVEAITGLGMFKTCCFYTLMFCVLFLKDPDLLDAFISFIIDFGNYLENMSK